MSNPFCLDTNKPGYDTKCGLVPVAHGNKFEIISTGGVGLASTPSAGMKPPPWSSTRSGVLNDSTSIVPFQRDSRNCPAQTLVGVFLTTQTARRQQTASTQWNCVFRQDDIAASPSPARKIINILHSGQHFGTTIVW